MFTEFIIYLRERIRFSENTGNSTVTHTGIDSVLNQVDRNRTLNFTPSNTTFVTQNNVDASKNQMPASSIIIPQFSKINTKFNYEYTNSERLSFFKNCIKTLSYDITSSKKTTISYISFINFIKYCNMSIKGVNMILQAIGISESNTSNRNYKLIGLLSEVINSNNSYRYSNTNTDIMFQDLTYNPSTNPLIFQKLFTGNIGDPGSSFFGYVPGGNRIYTQNTGTYTFEFFGLPTKMNEDFYNNYEIKLTNE